MDNDLLSFTEINPSLNSLLFRRCQMWHCCCIQQ